LAGAAGAGLSVWQFAVWPRNPTWQRQPEYSAAFGTLLQFACEIIRTTELLATSRALRVNRHRSRLGTGAQAAKNSPHSFLGCQPSGRTETVRHMRFYLQFIRRAGQKGKSHDRSANPDGTSCGRRDAPLETSADSSRSGARTPPWRPSRLDHRQFASYASCLAEMSHIGCHAHACRGHVNRLASHAHGKRGHGTQHPVTTLEI